MRAIAPVEVARSARWAGVAPRLGTGAGPLDSDHRPPAPIARGRYLDHQIHFSSVGVSGGQYGTGQENHPRIHADPKLVDELVSAPDDDARKGLLEKHGLVKKGQHGPTREEAEAEIRKLVGVPVREAGEEERAVEWVAAIGTAAAGAGAAFCVAE